MSDSNRKEAIYFKRFSRNRRKALWAVAAAFVVILSAVLVGRWVAVDPVDDTLPQPLRTVGEVVCDRYAAVDGSDGAAGSRTTEPFQTAQRLVRSLGPGETGCLESGTYTESDKTLSISSGGTPDQPVVLSSAPGAQATILGRLNIDEAADYVTVRDLVLDGSEAPRGSSDGVLPSPTVNGDHVVFIGNEVTNRHRGICFSLGDSPTLAESTLIQSNRIHDCGRLSRRNIHHGVYVSAAKNTAIVGNLIYDNADRGIQLYPDAQGTLIEGNVIQSNGQGIVFSGSGSEVSSNNTVRNNVISNSRVGWNVFGSWNQTSRVGTDNVVDSNCLWATSQREPDNQNGGISPEDGFDAYDNLIAEPRFADPEARDFTLADDSPCRDVLGDRSDLFQES